MDVNTFLEEKRRNLVKFLRAEAPQFEPLIAKLESELLPALKAYILEVIVPYYPNRLEAFVRIKMDEMNIKESDVKKEVLSKFLRYLECFCTVMK